MQLGLTNSCCLQEIKPGNHRNLTLLFILLLVCRHLVNPNRIQFAIKKLCSPFITFILAPMINPALSYSVTKSGEGARTGMKVIHVYLAMLEIEI